MNTHEVRTLVNGPRRKCPTCGATAQCQLAFGAAPGRTRWRIECTDLECSFAITIEEGPRGGLTVVDEPVFEAGRRAQPPKRKCPLCSARATREGLCSTHFRFMRTWQRRHTGTPEEFVDHWRQRKAG